MPPGRPVAVFANGRTHVFAIGTGGVLWHWSSADGVVWTPPSPLPFGNLPASYPAATALADGSIHVLAVGAGSLTSGGPLVYFHSPDGTSWFPPTLDATWSLPAGSNGVAITPSAASQVDGFAATPNGIVHYAWNAVGQKVNVFQLPPEPNLPRSVPAAVSATPNLIDVFAVGSVGEALRWHGNITWTKTVLLPPPGISPLQLVKSGFVAITPSAGRIELFAIAHGGVLLNWTFDQTAQPVPIALPLPAAMTPLSEGIPAAVIVRDHIEVFAIGPPADPFTGGPLLRWRRDGNTWSGPVVIPANLAAGGVGAAAGGNRMDAFAIHGGGDNSLQHWPAGVAGADHDPWSNWANNRHTNPAGHCRPKTLEELVAIVKTAEKLPGARVRAVGSSWSFSGISQTLDGLGFVVETNGMNQVLSYVITPDVLTASAPASRYLIHAEGGIILNDLMNILDGRGLAPFTMGGESGQTLVGAISTSVHGSDVDRGPLPNAVRAIHLVGAGGVQHWIEPDQWRITDSAALQARLGPGVQVHYDDDMFDSALVSVGALGIVYSVVLEVTDQYFLVLSRRKDRWSVVRNWLASTAAFESQFDGNRYVEIAIDPGGTGDRWCYTTTLRQAPVGIPTPTTSIDPLAIFCQTDIVTAIGAVSAAQGVASAVVQQILAVVMQIVAPFIPAFPPLALIPTLGLVPATLPALIAAIKAGPPGTLLNFVGSVLNVDAGFAAATMSYITDQQQPVGVDRSQDVAHKILAPVQLGECAARGRGVELVLDTRYNEHLLFLDDMLAMLDAQRATGNVLGGWISVRFGGPARAILSPERSARSCMVEVVGLDTMRGTQPIFDAFEMLGAKHNATPHWGMFNSFPAARVKSAFPRLDSWKRIRFQLSAGGTLHTFDNQLTNDAGLEDPAAGVPLLQQDGWRWCRKCMAMVWSGGPGPCAAGANHDLSASGNYGFPINVWSAPGERDWRWCNKCQMLVNSTGGPCMGGGNHTPGTSDYTVLLSGVQGWQRCGKCQAVFYPQAVQTVPPKTDLCPAGGTHTGSGNYWVALTGTGVPGQRGWLLCNRCDGLTNGAGLCKDGAVHARGGIGYTLAWNAPTAPGQAHWRVCNKCGTLVLGPGACFAGGLHDSTGSGDYTLSNAARQGSWRRCKYCHGLWFSGAGGSGVCHASLSGHDLGTNEYFVATP
jgi:hypothetical protein